MNVAILILAHKRIDYFLNLAKNNPDIFFYIHFDRKSKLAYENLSLKNIFFITQRFDIKWGGFSQVNATLELFRIALKNPEVEFLHLVSGEDIVLSKDRDLLSNLKWDSNEIFMELLNSKRHRFRVRFFAPHVEKKWQRKIAGKALTFGLKILDKILYTNKFFWFGSNWFSIRRSELEIILSNLSIDDINFFKKRLNPDEHFFQYLVVKSNLTHQISSSGNKRLIVFDKNYNNGNNPIYLSADVLECNFSRKKYFFSRKVNADLQINLYEKVNKT